MKYIFIFSFILIFSFSIVQSSDFEVFSPFLEGNIGGENTLKDYNHYNLEPLIYPEKDFLGFIREDYTRIHIFYTEIEQDESNSHLYHVTGASVVMGNKCDFEGEIIVREFREYLDEISICENNYYHPAIKSRGVVFAEYNFRENPEQNHVGVFSGVLMIKYFIDEFGLIHSDDLNNCSDIYFNNAHVGIWTEYSSGKEDICNWGVHRILHSGGLDIGTGKFSPNPEYRERGWENLIIE
jgi:hypothetical protein